MAAVPDFTIKDLLEAGAHYGHKTSRWNPRMAPFIYGSRNGVHIIDLQQTAPMLHRALKKVYEVVRKNGRVLFVGTKPQASESIAEAAKRCGQYYVNHRWLGGMLTNWKTISVSIKTLRDIEERLDANTDGLTKKEILNMSRERDKLRRALGGIMDLGGKPDLLFVIDTNKEHIAIAEAKKLGIPVIGIVDSNSNPDCVNYAIPGNDDATRAIALYCQLLSDSALAGLEEALTASGVDVGAAKDIAQNRGAKTAKVNNENAAIAAEVGAMEENAALVVEKKRARVRKEEPNPEAEPALVAATEEAAPKAAKQPAKAAPAPKKAPAKPAAEKAPAKAAAKPKAKKA